MITEKDHATRFLKLIKATDASLVNDDEHSSTDCTQSLKTTLSQD